MPLTADIPETGPEELASYTAVHIETTGDDPLRDRIILLSAVRIADGRGVSSFRTLIDPEIYLPAERVKTTGITDAKLKGAPKLDEMLKAFAEFIGSSPVVCSGALGHIIFLKMALARAGHDAGMRLNDIDELYSEVKKRGGEAAERAAELIKNAQNERPEMKAAAYARCFEYLKHNCRASEMLTTIEGAMQPPVSDEPQNAQENVPERSAGNCEAGTIPKTDEGNGDGEPKTELFTEPDPKEKAFMAPPDAAGPEPETLPEISKTEAEKTELRRFSVKLSRVLLVVFSVMMIFCLVAFILTGKRTLVFIAACLIPFYLTCFILAARRK